MVCGAGGVEVGNLTSDLFLCTVNSLSRWVFRWPAADSTFLSISDTPRKWRHRLMRRAQSQGWDKSVCTEFTKGFILDDFYLPHKNKSCCPLPKTEILYITERANWLWDSLLHSHHPWHNIVGECQTLQNYIIGRFYYSHERNGRKRKKSVTTNSLLGSSITLSPKKSEGVGQLASLIQPMILHTHDKCRVLNENLLLMGVLLVGCWTLLLSLHSQADREGACDCAQQTIAPDSERLSERGLWWRRQRSRVPLMPALSVWVWRTSWQHRSCWVASGPCLCGPVPSSWCLSPPSLGPSPTYSVACYPRDKNI